MQIFFSHWVFAALSWVKYYSLRCICYSVSIHHKLDLIDTCCGYYCSALDSLDEGQISFMNVTAEMDRSTHLSSLTDSANVEGATPGPSFWTNVRNASVRCSIWNHEGKPPCKCIRNERRIQEVHYSLSATFISEYQMNMINVERGGGGGGMQSKPRIWDEWYCYYTTNDEQQKLRRCETAAA